LISTSRRWAWSSGASDSSSSTPKTCKRLMSPYLPVLSSGGFYFLKWVGWKGFHFSTLHYTTLFY
jgi:hypothetical protein